MWTTPTMSDVNPYKLSFAFKPRFELVTSCYSFLKLLNSSCLRIRRQRGRILLWSKEVPNRQSLDAALGALCAATMQHLPRWSCYVTSVPGRQASTTISRMQYTTLTLEAMQVRGQKKTNYEEQCIVLSSWSWSSKIQTSTIQLSSEFECFQNISMNADWFLVVHTCTQDYVLIQGDWDFWDAAFIKLYTVPKMLGGTIPKKLGTNERAVCTTNPAMARYAQMHKHSTSTSSTWNHPAVQLQAPLVCYVNALWQVHDTT